MPCQVFTKLSSLSCGEEEGSLKLVRVRGGESFDKVTGAVFFTCLLSFANWAGIFCMSPEFQFVEEGVVLCQRLSFWLAAFLSYPCLSSLAHHGI